MKTFITSIALTILLTAIPAAAQDITGRLVDESGDPVAYASVVIISRPDSAYMTGATTAEDAKTAGSPYPPGRVRNMTSQPRS